MTDHLKADGSIKRHENGHQDSLTNDSLKNNVPMNTNPKEDMSLQELLSSQEWREYFLSLSDAVNFEFEIYTVDGSPISATKEPVYCEFLRSANLEIISCPDTCNKEMFESLSSDEPLMYKCKAGLANFAFQVERSGEKVVVVGRGNFSSYDDLLQFLKLARDNNLSEIPQAVPLSFVQDDYLKSIARYVCFTVTRMLSSTEERSMVEEKLVRMTALFDSQTFGTLSKNPELMYRYIMDTIEFVFGSTSASFLLQSKSSFKYKTVYATGEHKDTIMELSLDNDSQVIHEMKQTKSVYFSENPGTIISAVPLGEIKSAYFFPIFTEGSIQGIIGIYNRKFSSDDLRIMASFRDYVQLNLENQHLRTHAVPSIKEDSRMSSLSEFSQSLSNILDKDSLLNTLLNKSLQLLEAEQGSLMIMDPETSELIVEARKCIDGTVKEKMRLKMHNSIAGQVIESGGPLLVKDIEQDARIKQGSRERYKTKSFISVPIMLEDRLKGVMNISDKIKGTAFTEDDLNLVQSIMNSAAIVIERTLLYDRAKDLQKLSITDPLTGIYNRRYLNRRLSEEITRFNRYKHPFSFMMLDLDKFKEYNDTYGHIPGDNLIRDLARTLEQSLRTIDIAARFGGDEFVAIFPQTSKDDAIQITNRLKEKIDDSLGRYDVDMPLSVSMGLATFPDDANSIMELIEKTDQALYLAKKAGGNRVVYL